MSDYTIILLQCKHCNAQPKTQQRSKRSLFISLIFYYVQLAVHFHFLIVFYLRFYTFIAFIIYRVAFVFLCFYLLIEDVCCFINGG